MYMLLIVIKAKVKLKQSDPYQACQSPLSFSSLKNTVRGLYHNIQFVASVSLSAADGISNAHHILCKSAVLLSLTRNMNTLKLKRKRKKLHT